MYKYIRYINPRNFYTLASINIYINKPRLSLRIYSIEFTNVCKTLINFIETVLYNPSKCM